MGNGNYSSSSNFDPDFAQNWNVDLKFSDTVCIANGPHQSSGFGDGH